MHSTHAYLSAMPAMLSSTARRDATSRERSRRNPRSVRRAAVVGAKESDGKGREGGRKEGRKEGRESAIGACVTAYSPVGGSIGERGDFSRSSMDLSVLRRTIYQSRKIRPGEQHMRDHRHEHVSRG